MDSTNKERCCSPDRLLQVWQRGTLLTVLRTEEIRRKLDQTCTHRTPRHAVKATPNRKPTPPQQQPSAKPEKRPQIIRSQLIDLAKLRRTEHLLQQGHTRTARALDAQSFRLAQEMQSEELSESLLHARKAREMQSYLSHLSFIRKRAENAASKRRVRREGQDQNYVERLEAYVEKTLREDTRVERVKEALSKSMVELRKKRETKEKVAEFRRKAVEKELEQHLEHCKAKESRSASERPHKHAIESIPADFERIKRIQAERVEALLSKLVYDSQRVEDLKQSKEAAIAQKQEQQRERMLAMERHWKELEKLAKKPELGKTRRMLRALGVRSHSP